VSGYFTEAAGRTFDISPDSRRFLMIKDERDSRPSDDQMSC
jgi:hypothetical protein